VVPYSATTLGKTQIAPSFFKSLTKKYFAKNSQNSYVKFSKEPRTKPKVDL
jgi:hypothetical protein